MPLPSPDTQRTPLHRRQVSLEGYKREDGLWEIEARIVDTKAHDYVLSSGTRRQGEALHDMSVRVTIDRQMTIVDAVACTDAAPYMGYCDVVPPDYARIVGLNLFHGFRKAVKELFDSVKGCAHVSELLMFLPTVALQTFASEMPDYDDTHPHKPYQLDRCHALESHAPAVERYYPRWYRRPKVDGQEAAKEAVNSVPPSRSERK